jgi:CRP-like cAMP-binding protein
LVLKGRVGCYEASKVCFKTFVAGSYFGELEIFMQSVRQFSIISHTKTLLLAIEEQHLKTVLSEYPGAYKSVIERSLRRMMSFEFSLHKIKDFKGIRPDDLFWDVRLDGNNGEEYVRQHTGLQGSGGEQLCKLVMHIVKILEQKQQIGSLDL